MLIRQTRFGNIFIINFILIFHSHLILYFVFITLNLEIFYRCVIEMHILNGL